jgi:hypothetical protein
LDRFKIGVVHVVHADPDLEWLLCVLPSLLGCVGSGHSGLVAALERGQALGGGGNVPDSRRAEDTFERALPHLARARRQEDVWARPSTEQRRILEAHYRRPLRGNQASPRSSVCVFRGIVITDSATS